MKLGRRAIAGLYVGCCYALLAGIVLSALLSGGGHGPPIVVCAILVVVYLIVALPSSILTLIVLLAKDTKTSSFGVLFLLAVLVGPLLNLLLWRTYCSPSDGT
jgi:hypothetical protein